MHIKGVLLFYQYYKEDRNIQLVSL